MSTAKSKYDAVIVGAGIIGVTLAYELTEAGLRVAVVEQRDRPACETSFANGGLITPSMSDPWAAPGVPGKLLQWLGKEDAPLLLRLKAVPGLARWGTAFLANCNRKSWEENIRNMVSLSQHSQKRLRLIVKKNGLDGYLSSCGGLRIFSDENSLNAALADARFLETSGIRHEVVSAERCLSIEPALARAPASIAGGLYYPDDQSGDCRGFTEALAGLVQSRGCDFRYATMATGLSQGSSAAPTSLETDKGAIEGGAIIIATSFAPKWLRPKPLLYPVKGYSLTLDIPEHGRAPCVPIIDDKRKIGVVRLGDKLRLVGTAEFTGDDRTLNDARLSALIQNTRAIVPDIDSYPAAQRWSGMRAMSPDGAPYIGAVSKRVFMSLGFGHLGWTNACGAAALLKDLVTGAVPDIDPVPFSPQRQQ